MSVPVMSAILEKVVVSVVVVVVVVLLLSPGGCLGRKTAHSDRPSRDK